MIAMLLVQIIIASRRRERAMRGIDAKACRLPWLPPACRARWLAPTQWGWE